MPAEIVTMADCQSNYGIFEIKGSQGDLYVVTLNGSEGPAFCRRKDGSDCPAYKYSGEERHCKHITQAWEGACVYNPQWCDGHQPIKFKPIDYTYDLVVPRKKCPNCKGPMVAVRRAV